MGGKKGGGSAHVPYEAPNTLYSKQQVKVLDVISEGPVEGLVNGNAHPFKSIYFNDTPVQAANDAFNFFGFNLAMTTGERDQTYLPEFDVVEKTNQVNADVKFDSPITRTVTDPNVSAIRVTVGANGLLLVKDNGDRVGTSVSVQVSILKNGSIYTSQVKTIEGKGTESFYQDVKFEDLPEVPFDVRVTRITADSSSDKLQNSTVFPSFVESIDAKLSYKHLAVAGYKFDAQQFGSSLPRINTLMKLQIVDIPTNYDPINRVYTGMWDGSFKKSWTDNPAWIIYHFARNNRFGGNIDARYINRAALYKVSQFCDEMVDDGRGGKEPRVTFNALYTSSKPFHERLQDMASAIFGLAFWDGQYLTFTLDRDEDPVHVYTNANVIGGSFTYEGISHNAVITDVQVQYNDKNDAYRQKIEVVEDLDLLRRYPRNTKKVGGEGCTSQGQAHRLGRYILEKSKLQEVVNFVVGRDGLRHRPHDVIQIADNHAAGANIGGRIKSIEGNTVTLDREVENTKDAVFSYAGIVDGKFSRIEVDVLDQPSPTTLVLKEVTSDLKKFTTWNLSRTDVKPKYYRALGISDNGDGTYAIKAIEHEMGLQDRISDGIEFERDPDSIWTSYPEISNGTVGNNGDEIIITWDNINNDTTALTYTVKLYKDGIIYRTYEDLREPVLRFDGLPDGSYVAEIQARNARGQLSNILKQYFDLNFTITALTTRSEIFSVRINWQLPTIVNTSISTEIWRADVDDINEARALVVLPYPQSEYVDPGMSISEEYYYWARVSGRDGTTGEFTRSIYGKPSGNADDILGYLDGKISDKEISKDLQDQFDRNIDDKIGDIKLEIDSELDGIGIDLIGINSELDNIKTDITGIDSEIDGIKSDIISIDSEIESVKSDAEKALQDAEQNAKDILEKSEIIDSVSKKQGQAEANWLLAQMANVSAQKSQFSRSDVLTAQVANNISKIENVESVIVTDREATAFRFGQLNSRVGDAESKIISVEETLSDEIKAEASKREALEAVFDLSKASQQLQLMTQSSTDKSLSSRLFSMSASTANAHAKYDELQEVVATNEEARVTSEQKLQAEINSSKAEIGRIDQVMTSEFASQATSISNLSSELDGAKADIKQAEQTIVDNEKAQAKKNDEFNAQFDENEAKQQLSILTESTSTHSLSQRYMLLSAQTANSSAKIEDLQKVFADSEIAWGVVESRLQSQINDSKSEMSRIDKVSSEREKAQSIVNESLASELGTAKSDIEETKETIATNESAQAKRNESFDSKFDESEAQQQLSILTESTSSRSLSQRYLILSAQTANSSAKLESLEKVFADSETAWAVTESRLQAEIDASKSQISRIDKVIVDNEKAQSTAMSNLSSEIEDAKANITGIESTIATDKESQSLKNQEIDAELGENKAEQQLANMSQASDSYAKAQRLSVLSAQTANSQAKIQEIDEVVANEKEATAEQIRQLNSKVGENSSSITETSKTVADISGKVSSMWTLKVDANGAVGGIMLGSDGKESLFKVAADTFVISSGDQSVNMFTMQQIDGKKVAAFNVDDLIVKGSLSGEVLKANSKIISPEIEGGKLNIGGGKFTVSESGEVDIRANATKNVGMQITNDRINVYDENGRLRVRMGRLR